MKVFILCALFLFPLSTLSGQSQPAAVGSVRVPPTPLIVDPFTGNAGDPTAIYNHSDKTLWVFYTQRRIGSPAALDYSWWFGTNIGIASSSDGGMHWYYRGIAEGLTFQPGRNTYWAPEVIYHEGIYHMFVTFLQGVPATASGPPDYKSQVLHYCSADLLQWKLVSSIPLSSDNVIDPVVNSNVDGTWAMWYKDEQHGSHIWEATSRDLNTWKVRGEVVGDRDQEGPFVFRWHEYYWMITDIHAGLLVHRSRDGVHWVKQTSPLLNKPGKRKGDQWIGGHCSVLTQGDSAYIFYQTGDAINVAPLEYRDGQLYVNRDGPFEFSPQWSLVPAFRGGGLVSGSIEK